MTVLAEPRTAERVGYRLVEAFGPTVQGEGPDAGRRAFFVRLGGCDYRCSWCDSMHAVEPELVRQAPRVSARQVALRVCELGAVTGDLVVLSGGNPALYRGSELVRALHRQGLHVSVETQGSVWREWLDEVDRLVVSPKPPSSGMADRTAKHLDGFLDQAWRAGVYGRLALKVVVFDRTDYAWAQRLINDLARRPPWVGLSCGTDSKGGEDVLATARRYRWLCEEFAHDLLPAMAGVTVLPQLHVIAWGHELGR